MSMSHYDCSPIRRTSTAICTNATFVLLHIVAALLLGTADAAAQNRPEVMAFPPEITGYIRMGGIYHENFFQLPDDGPREDVVAGVMEVRVEERLGPSGAMRVYTRGDVFHFRHLGSSPGALVGVRRIGGVHQFDVAATGQWNRPRFDLDDDPQQANVIGGNANYSLRVVRPLELMVLGEYSRQWLKQNVGVRSATYDVGGAVLFRPIRRLSTEIGVLRGRRDIADVNQQYLNETAYVAMRTSIVPRTYVSLRYRTRVRDYTTDNTRSSNFQRQDRREQVTAYLDLSLWGNLVWNLSAGVEEADSTKRGSSFRSKQFGTTFSVMLPEG
jgi:hypothetical protein